MSVLGLQAYAILLAVLRLPGGIRTDEAKYLLDIPYPHPPFLRSILHLTDGWSGQELFWRVILATLFIQAAWLVWDMTRDLRHDARVAAAAAWLLSAGVILQTGAIMLAPVNAVQALVLLWLLVRPGITAKHPLLVSLFWTASLFAAYQAFLFFPLAVAVFARAGFRRRDIALYACAPIALLVLYTLQNPLAIRSIIHHGGEDAASSLMVRLLASLRLWLVAGSGLVSVLGVVGLAKERRPELIVSFLLIGAFILLNRFDYYAVLFAPLLVWGLITLLRSGLAPRPVLAALLPCMIILLALNAPEASPSPARATMRALGEQHLTLISGNFGHEWQYESASEVRRYREDLLPQATAVVCPVACENFPRGGWLLVASGPVEAYVRAR